MFPRQSILFFVWHPATAVQERVLRYAAALNQYYSLVCGRRIGGNQLWSSTDRGMDSSVSRHCGMTDTIDFNTTT